VIKIVFGFKQNAFLK